MAPLNSPSSKSPIWIRDRVSSPSRSHFSPGLKLILRTQVTNPEIATFQYLSKGVYGLYKYLWPGSVCTHANHSNIFYSEFYKQQEKQMDLSRRLSLIQDIDTSWNSTYYMLQRFIYNKTAIAATLLEI